MKIKELNCEELKIPLNVSFQHSTAERNETESVIVQCDTDAGITALGEGCPRSYVTGETIDSALAFFLENRADWIEITSLNALTNWVSDRREEIDLNPAAFAAVETSILNALSLEEGKSVEALLGLPEIEGRFSYSAVLGTRSREAFQAQLEQYVKVGFQDYKLKLFGTPDVDKENLNLMKERLVVGATLRFDANNLWNGASTAIEYLSKIELDYFAVEEPIGVQDFEGLSQIADTLGKRVILDESFLRMADFENLATSAASWIINLRVSKMGGVIRSLEIAENASQLGIPIIIGAQVGETSILTRAALTIANAYKEILVAQEGAYGTHLLSYDLIDPPIMFGAGGILEL